MARVRVPPGRAGRLWLRRRLAAADRGAGLLEQKLRGLRAEHRRLADSAAAGARRWTEQARTADTWAIRAALLTGDRGLRLADTGESADVRVDWVVWMGVRYPAGAHCALPVDVPVGGAAVVQAARAYRAALDTAVRLAADEAAVGVLAAEIAATGRRVRALRRRWIPMLVTELARVELALDEQDRAEAIGHRLAAGRNDRNDPRPAAR